MDVVKSQLERIRQQLAGLTATQRMLAGTLVAVMVLTLMYWGKYASNPEMVPVLDQALSTDEIAQIDAALEAKGVPHTVAAGKVLVPAERKMEIVADLMWTQQLPHQTQNAFLEMSKQLNPFSTPTQTEATYNQATQMTLAQIIRRFPGVADAQVIINPKMERRIENSIMPTAAVVITTRDAPTPGHVKQLVAAAADGVVGAVAGIKRGSVNVIINGISKHVADVENNSLASNDDLNDLRQSMEEREEQRILSLFSYINGLTATVSCDVDNRSLIERKHTVDSLQSKELKSETHTDENNNAAPPAADPGVGANTAATIGSTGAGSGGSANSSTDEKTENYIAPSTTDVDTQTPAGKVTVVSATVRVPRSFIVGMLKQENPNAKEPDDAAVQAKAKTELASIREGVRNCIGLKTVDMLSVDTYTDVSGSIVALQLAATAATPAGASISSVTAYGKEIAIGVLAVISLFMMSSMVKKSAPAPVVSSPVVHEPPPVLVAGEGLAGEAGDTDQTLAGMELDEDAVHAQQMLEQVTTMVKENPDGAASLVKRWLNRS